MKCKFWKICEKYSDVSHTCNKAGGMYYSDETEPADCYLEICKKEGKN